jgi:hypothetical protein
MFLKEIILQVRKYFANLKEKTTNGVDRPKWAGYSLISLLNVFQEIRNKSALFKN